MRAARRTMPRCRRTARRRQYLNGLDAEVSSTEDELMSNPDLISDWKDWKQVPYFWVPCFNKKGERTRTKYIACNLGTCEELPMQQTNHVAHRKSIYEWCGPTRKGQGVPENTFLCKYCDEVKSLAAWARHYKTKHQSEPEIAKCLRKGKLPQPPLSRAQEGDCNHKNVFQQKPC